MGHGQGHGHDGERQWPDHDQKGPSLRLWENLVGRSVGRPVGRSVVPGWRRRAEARGRRRRRRRQQLNTHQVQDRRTAESRSNSCISNHMQCNRNTAEHASERELLCTATACGSRRRAQRSRRCHGRILLGNRIPGLGGRGWPGVGARGGGEGRPSTKQVAAGGGEGTREGPDRAALSAQRMVPASHLQHRCEACRPYQCSSPPSHSQVSPRPV